MSKKDEKFTWADLKKIVNKMPASALKREVVGWKEESGVVVTGVMILKEDYLYDGDEGCAPRSTLQDAIAEAKKDGWEDEYHVVHPKGTRILDVE